MAACAACTARLIVFLSYRVRALRRPGQRDRMLRASHEIMMLVSYRPLAAGVLLALLERYMRVDCGDKGSVGPTALNPFYPGPGEML